MSDKQPSIESDLDRERNTTLYEGRTRLELRAKYQHMDLPSILEAVLGPLLGPRDWLKLYDVIIDWVVDPDNVPHLRPELSRLSRKRFVEKLRELESAGISPYENPETLPERMRIPIA